MLYVKYGKNRLQRRCCLKMLMMMTDACLYYKSTPGQVVAFLTVSLGSRNSHVTWCTKRRQKKKYKNLIPTVRFLYAFVISLPLHVHRLIWEAFLILFRVWQRVIGKTGTRLKKNRYHALVVPGKPLSLILCTGAKICMRSKGEKSNSANSEIYMRSINYAGKQ